jgi:cytochrome c peroxidase
LTAAVLVRAQAPLVTTPQGLDAFMPVPSDNPLTGEKIALGRKLFPHTRLSRSQTVACGTRHDVKQALTDGRNVAEGRV